MNIAFLLTGGNMGNSFSTLQEAASAIEEKCGAIVQRSAIYQTAAWGNEDQPDFLNQVLKISTELGAHELLKILLDIEQMLGRTRHKKYDPRIIDIDILFFNDLVINTEDLQIPHPRLQLRRFVLVPLNEIASHLVHPVFHKNVKELLEDCPDVLNVKKFSGK